MRELTSTITKKGQATIPGEIRRLLGVGPHDKLAFIIENGQVRLERRRSVVERTYGVLKSHLPPLSAGELRDAAEQAWAEEAIARDAR